MVKYARRDPICDDWEKAVKAKTKDCRVHFKNTREAAKAIKNMPLLRAKAYLANVLDHKGPSKLYVIY